VIELLRNCLHGSDIATYIVDSGGQDRKIIKVASTRPGMDNLLREVDGWNWYQDARSPGSRALLCEVLVQSENYLKIQMPFISGSKADFNSGLESNAELVEKTIDHYCNIWPYTPHKNAALHGDLSIDNIICNSGGIYIIDWEHYSYDGAPWGFDGLYLLFETLWFGMKQRACLTANELAIIIRSLEKINARKYLPTEMAETPLKYLKEYIICNHEKWGDQLLKFPNKLPIRLFTNNQTMMIDNAIHSAIQR
jgi:hypothetical protein